MIYRLLNIGLLLFAFTFAAYTQTREEKTAAIINQWDLVNIRKLRPNLLPGLNSFEPKLQMVLCCCHT